MLKIMMKTIGNGLENGTVETRTSIGGEIGKNRRKSDRTLLRSA
jgi:hypothetical protein